MLFEPLCVVPDLLQSTLLILSHNPASRDLLISLDLVPRSLQLLVLPLLHSLLLALNGSLSLLYQPLPLGDHLLLPRTHRRLLLLALLHHLLTLLSLLLALLLHALALHLLLLSLHLLLAHHLLLLKAVIMTASTPATAALSHYDGSIFDLHVTILIIKHSPWRHRESLVTIWKR